MSHHTLDPNPVVMLDGDNWHIVESGRASTTGLCGRPLRQRRAHSRLNTVGRDHVCPDCLHAYDTAAAVSQSR